MWFLFCDLVKKNDGLLNLEKYQILIHHTIPYGLAICRTWTSTLLKESGNILKENGIKGEEYPMKSFGKSIKKFGELFLKIM